MLYWTARCVEVPVGFDDVLDGWVDIDARERALGVDEATPILIDPVSRIDPRLTRFFRRSRFAFLAEGTRQSYVKDYRLFFSFLWRRGKCWDQADYDDIGDYEAWRRRSTDNPRRVGGAKWARELAAFKLLFDWAVVTAQCSVARLRHTRCAGATAPWSRWPTVDRGTCGSPTSSG
ncbi:site-specific integrase [Rhodococcus koreensis]